MTKSESETLEKEKIWGSRKFIHEFPSTRRSVGDFVAEKRSADPMWPKSQLCGSRM